MLVQAGCLFVDGVTCMCPASQHTTARLKLVLLLILNQRMLEPLLFKCVDKMRPDLTAIQAVQAFSDLFLSTNMRMTVVSPIDATTLAGYYKASLKRKVKEALSTSMPVDAMHDLHIIITSAVNMEPKLNLHWHVVPAWQTDSA